MAELFSSPRITDDKNLTPERSQIGVGEQRVDSMMLAVCSNERSITYKEKITILAARFEQTAILHPPTGPGI